MKYNVFFMTIRRFLMLCLPTDVSASACVAVQPPEGSSDAG